MGFRIIAPKRIKKVKTPNGQEVLRRLEEYLESAAVTGEPIEFLCGFWKDQQNAITYQELRQAVIDGEVSNETLELWAQDYSVLVATKLNSMWMNALAAGAAGQPILDNLNIKFNMHTPGIMRWINERGAAFVTVCTDEQKSAIAALLSKKMRDGHTVDELSRLIRPCIGLTEGDAKAVARFYDNVAANLKKEHPRMKPESIRRKALSSSQKYAERKHRQRAMTIAQTESAFAYNRGADEGIRQAQQQNLLGVTKKRWCTSGDDSVCDVCASMDGMEIDMDDDFNIKGKILFRGQHLMPPAHPRCACAIEYIEVSPPIFPQMQISVTDADSYKCYSDEEIQSIANQTERIASKHIDIESKWSGKIVVNDDGEKFGKLWSCDIISPHETAPHIILHEQIHARSISYYNETTYRKYARIEEAAVQFMAQEVSMMEGIEIIKSQYDDMADALRIIGQRIGIYKTDYNFAKAVIEMPVVQRLDWISKMLYDTMSSDSNATIEDYSNLTALLDMLY